VSEKVENKSFILRVARGTRSGVERGREEGGRNLARESYGRKDDTLRRVLKVFEESRNTPPEEGEGRGAREGISQRDVIVALWCFIGI